MSFIFSWPHAAKEVFVTGTFDNWSKSVQLDPTDSTVHEKEVQLPETDKKIYYKVRRVVEFVWTRLRMRGAYHQAIVRHKRLVVANAPIDGPTSSADIYICPVCCRRPVGARPHGQDRDGSRRQR